MNAMRSLQSKQLGHQKLDIHYSIPKVHHLSFHFGNLRYYFVAVIYNFLYGIVLLSLVLLSVFIAFKLLVFAG